MTAIYDIIHFIAVIYSTIYKLRDRLKIERYGVRVTLANVPIPPPKIKIFR